MDSQPFVSLLGEGTESADLAQALNSVGRGLSEVTPSEIRTEGASSILFPHDGLELVFRERNAFESKFAQPKSAGYAILVSVIAYPNGNAQFKPYLGNAPFCAASAADRANALRLLGTPALTDSDDGVVKWDQWERGGLQLRATYDKQLSIRRIGTSVPMRKA